MRMSEPSFCPDGSYCHRSIPLMSTAVIVYDGVMGRWEPDARGRLAKAALELYSEQGFDQTTVEDIARRAGLTERTFFRHFSDKREVLFSGASALETQLLTGVRCGAGVVRRVRLGRRRDRCDRRRLREPARIRASSSTGHQRERGASGARTHQTRVARFGPRCGVAAPRRRRHRREPSRRNGDRRLPRGIRALDRRSESERRLRRSSRDSFDELKLVVASRRAAPTCRKACKPRPRCRCRNSDWRPSTSGSTEPYRCRASHPYRRPRTSRRLG